MLFIGQQAVLIEVKNDGENYLIGEECYSTLPTWVLTKTLSSANWNRALRYLALDTQGFESLGFFLVRFDLYLKKDQIVCLAKKSFEQKILQQDKFQKEFLAKIFAFRSRNCQTFLTKPLPDLNLDLEIIDELKIDLNRCWVSKNFLLKNYKYKILFKSGKEFKVEKTKQNQLIYYFDFDFDDWDLIDFKTGVFYEEGRYQINVEVCLKFLFEDQIRNQVLLEKMIETVKKTTVIPQKHKNWHLYNLTNDLQYLITELTSIFTNCNFIEGLLYLESLFKEMQTNYLALIFSLPQIQSLLWGFAISTPEKEELRKLVKRYGVLPINF